MLKNNFRRICDTNRFTVTFIHIDTGINRGTLTNLYKNRIKRIELETLDRLLIFFNKYFKCTTSDIIEFINNP